MYDVLSSSFVVSYNKNYFEQHTNSSEFDNKRKVKASKWRKRLILVTSEIRQRENSEKLFLYKVNTNPEKCKRKRDLIATTSNNISKTLEFSMEKLLNCHNYDEDIKSGNHIKSCQSGKSVISKKTSKFLKRQQIFPCLSNMLNNSTKHVEKKFKETSVGTNGEFSCLRCERRRIKRLRRRMFYDTISPYYNIGDNRPPLELAHGLRSPLFYNAKTIRNQISAASSSSLTSIESDLEYIPWQGSSRRHVKNQILKNQMHDIPKRKILKNKKQQCPSRIRNSGPYKIIATPCWEENISKNCETNSYPCELQSTSSSFWDYIIDKIAKKQMKHHDQDFDSLKCCPCRQLLKADENPKAQNCECKKVHTGTCVTASQTESTVEQKPSVILIPNQNKTATKIDESSLIQPYKNITCDCLGTIHAVSRDASQNSKTAEKVFPTPSTSEKMQQAKPKEPDEGGSRKPKVDKSEKTCQASHEAILKKLKQKYNGEILCIHNPPCILINGCLNLPPPRVKPTTVCYPVTQIKKASVYNLYRRMWRQKLNKGPEKVNSKFAYIPSNSRLPARNAEDIKHSFFQKHLCELVHMCSKPHYGINAVNRRTKTVKKPPRLIQKKRSAHREHRQDFKMPKKIVVVAPGNKVETPTPSKSNVISGGTGKSSGWSSSSPTRHKSRLLRMIRARR